MSDTFAGRGRCLCGAVTIEARGVPHAVGACHCSMCRRWGGGPLLAVECGTDVTLDGHEKVTVFASSDWAERGFCRVCGTHLFYRLRESGEYYLPAGLFDNGDFTLTSQVFIDEKPGYYSFAEETRNLTGAEAFAQYAPPDPD